MHLVSFYRKQLHKDGDCRDREHVSRTVTLWGVCIVILLFFKYSAVVVMPPKKPAADSAGAPVPSPSDSPVEEKVKAKSDAAALRKISTHPSTAIMVNEALKELDSRKGVSSQAIQNYIKQKYPSVDLVRLKHLVRRALKKGIETGTLVRPANSSSTTGAMGKFRLAPKVKEPKSKTENTDPNVQKAPKPAKDGAKKKSPKAGVKKKKDVDSEPAKSKEESKPPKKSKKDEETATTTKAAPAKKPKAKKAAEKEDDKGAADSTKTKAAKNTKEAKASQSKVTKTGSDAPATKATGKRGRKAAE
ncbi:linker histone H1M [Paralichthys olivaceus]|uniref:linker histone H1M n=1 Tax=Paralichthys olivaceus TaxID=8255 RepID=UPI00097D672B|nr:PREDICTED: protein B4-like [Paralichthys olivaceus]